MKVARTFSLLSCQAGAELMLGAIKEAPEARKLEMRERAMQCLDRAERIKQ